MKRILIFILVLLIITISAGCGATPNENLPFASIKTYKDIPGVTKEEISAIETLKSSRDNFSYGAMLSTEAFVLPDGSYAGFTTKYCDLLSELFGINFVQKIYKWDDLINQLESQSLDFTGEMTATEDRMKIYSMSLPIVERQLRIFMSVDSDIKTETDINGLKIGFLEGSITANSIKNAYPVSFINIDVEDYDSAAMMIRNGDIDAFVDEAVSDPAFHEYDFIRSTIFFPMVHESNSMLTANPELAPVISVVNKYIDAGGVDKLYKLYKEGEFEYAKYKLNRSFTSEERAYIDDLTWRNASVAVAYEHDNYPVSFYNEKEGEFEGIAIDVLAEISRLTNIKFESVAAEDATWAEILEKINTGEVNIVTQLLFSETRRGQYLWSDPYARSYYAIMSRLDHPNLETYQVARATVGVIKQSGKKDIYHELFPDNNNLKEYATQNDCLDALESKEVDLLMASEYMMLTQTNYREKSGMKINIKLNVPLNSCFGFNKDDKILRSIIDKTLQYVGSDIIGISWTGRMFDYSKKLAEQRTAYMMVFISVLSLMLITAIFLLIRNIKLSKELKKIANYDALTGIFSRRFFMELASIEYARSLRTGINCFVIIFDLDHFKAVNDTYGHLAGDKVLKEVAQRAKKVIRQSDIFGRYGGEEFIIYIAYGEEFDKTNAINAVERIRLEIYNTPVNFEGIKIPVSASFGIAYASPRNDMNVAIKYADEALYRAKKEGRNRVVFYEDSGGSNRV